MAKILIADDDRAMSKAIEYRLKKDGFTVIAVLDGQQAMDQIHQSMPDLIITDIMMPFIGGLEIISQVRGKLGARTPIIVLSSVGFEDTVLEAFKLGADDFITKPFSPNELSVRVKRLLLPIATV